LDAHGHPAPTLRVKPGDWLEVTLQNDIAPPHTARIAGDGARPVPKPPHDPCSGGRMSAAATNLHFHGLVIPPICHQDETLRTLIEPGGAPFQYRIRIAPDQPPGLYWYHPHVHGFSEVHLLGGASGALIVEGIENFVPAVRGLPER